MIWKHTSLLIILILLPLTLRAVSPSELQQQIEQTKKEREILVEEQKKLQQELDLVSKEGQTLGAAVKSLDAIKKKLAKDVSITKSKITSTDLTIQSLEKTVSQKEQQIITHRQAISDTLSTLAEYDTQPLILSLLASVELSALWKDTSQLEGLNIRLGEEISALRETRKILTQEKAEKEKVKKEQVSLQGQLLGQKTVVEENQKAKETLLIETKNKEAEYQKMLAENLARQKESEADLYRLEAELQIELDPSLIPGAKRGILAGPLDKVFITESFGTRADRFHNGVDFRASVGTPVKAVLAGVVQGMGNTDDQKGCYSYGRWILIKHGNGLTSVYSHLSASIIQTGQSINTGQIIGYSGGYPRAYGSGNSSGPHLHLGLFASQGVEIRQFTTSRGCKQVFVPIARGIGAYLDPLAYLPTL